MRLSFGARKSLLRDRNGHGSAPVTQIELFFDLVFVFAVTQLSHFLLSDLTMMGVLRTLILFSAVWWVWVYTSWITNWLNPEERPVRLMLIGLMLAGLALSTSLPAAFAARGLSFAAAYVAMQAGRSLFMLWAVKNFDSGNYRNFQRILCWSGIAGIFWLLGGFAGAADRLEFWLIAVALDLASPAMGFFVPGLGRSSTLEWNIDSYHMAERCSAFILIALGESITVTGATFYGLQWTSSNTVAFLAAFLGVVAMWWIYFDTAAEHSSHAFAASSDPGRIARVSYTYLHALLVAGIIVVAVADEVVLAHPAAMPGLVGCLAVLGGPAIYLLGNGWFRRTLARLFPPSHVFGLACLVGLAVASRWLTLLGLALLTTGILMATAGLGSVLYHRQMKNPLET